MTVSKFILYNCSVIYHDITLGAAPTSSPSVAMGTSDLLTPVSAGLEGLSLGDKKSASFQVN